MPGKRKAKTARKAWKAGKATKRKAVKQPLGVAIISVLGFIGAILELLLGIIFVAFAPFIAGFVGPEFGSAAGLEAAALAIGVSLIIFSIIGMLAFYYLWKMRLSGFILLNVYGIISALAAVLLLDIAFAAVEVVVWAVVLGYVWKRKDFFVD